MTDDRRTHRGAVSPRRPTHPTHDNHHGRSTAVHTLHGTVARAIHEDPTGSTRTRPVGHEWRPPRRPHAAADEGPLGRSIVRLGERIAAEPVLTPARPR